ncbi:MAG: ferritin family protein [Dehalococcoidales bacterium]|nr:ferritin family protein [Dehalococcoidales bacterium]
MTAEQNSKIDALINAIQMEKDGKKYYQKAARVSRNDLGRSLFQSLALEEDIHRRKFETIFKALQAKKEWPEVDFTPDQGQRLKTLFATAMPDVKATDSEMAAVQTAMEMENKTRDFYLEQSEASALDIEKKYYAILAGEESAHHSTLLDYYEYLKNPADWFTIKEHHSLDGG